jgi:hypothetical protein
MPAFLVLLVCKNGTEIQLRKMIHNKKRSKNIVNNCKSEGEKKKPFV